jgi:hypothetical protein
MHRGLEANNEPCNCIFRLDASGRDNGRSSLVTVPPVMADKQIDSCR